MNQKCEKLVEFALIEDFKMCRYRTAHYFKEQVHKIAFQKHNLNKFGAAKIFIGNIFIFQTN